MATTPPQAGWFEGGAQSASNSKFTLRRGNPQDCQPQDCQLVANSEVGNYEYVHYSGLPTQIIHRNSGYNAPKPTLVLCDLQPPYLCKWQQAWDVVRKYFAFWSCEILTLLCILVYCSRSTPAHWVLGLSDQNGRTWPRSGGWFFLKFHNKLFKVM